MSGHTSKMQYLQECARSEIYCSLRVQETNKEAQFGNASKSCSHLVLGGGSRTACEGAADPGGTMAAVAIVTGKGLAGWTAPP